MMDIIVDTNIIFSSLTRSRRIQQTLKRLYTEGHQIHTVKELIEELDEHEEKLAKYSPIPPKHLKQIIHELLPKILNLHNTKEIPEKTKVKAKELVREVDPDDWPFIALAMHLEMPL